MPNCSTTSPSKRLRPYLTDDVLAEYYAVFDYDHLKHYDRRRVARLRGVWSALARRSKSLQHRNTRRSE